MQGERIAVSWEGKGSAVVDWIASQSVDRGKNRVTATFGANPGNTRVRLLVTDRNAPPKNPKVYQTRYDFNVAAGEKFNPDWLAHVKHFGTLRYMDPMRTNGSEITDWSKLRTRHISSGAAILFRAAKPDSRSL